MTDLGASPRSIRQFVSTLVWLLPPSGVKNGLLRWLGVKIGDDVRLGACVVVRAGEVRIGDGAVIGWFNVIRDVSRLTLEDGASIGQWNWFSASPEFSPTQAEVHIGPGGAVTSRHYVDCSGGFSVGEFAILAGHRSTVLSHEIDLSANRQVAVGVTIGARSFVSTNSVLLSGAVIPPRSVVAAGAVVTRKQFPEETLIAGVPARAVQPVAGRFFDRDEPRTPVA